MDGAGPLAKVAATAGVTARDLRVRAADGAELEAREYLPPGETAGGVLVLHGLGGSLNPDPWRLRGSCQDNEALLARGLAARGFHTLTYSQRGHGGSDCRLDLACSLRDLEHIARGPMGNHAGRLHAAGFSLGGWVALHVAAHHPGLFRSIAPIAAPHSMRGLLPPPVHALIRAVCRLPFHEPAARLALAGIRLAIQKRGCRGRYLRALATDPGERARAFTHMDDARLPDRLAAAYEDLMRSPELATLPAPVTDPVLLVRGAREAVVHRRDERAAARYLEVFRRGVADLRVEVHPTAGHEFQGPDGRSLLERDPWVVDTVASFFLSTAP